MESSSPEGGTCAVFYQIWICTSPLTYLALLFADEGLSHGFDLEEFLDLMLKLNFENIKKTCQQTRTLAICFCKYFGFGEMSGGEVALDSTFFNNRNRVCLCRSFSNPFRQHHGSWGEEPG
ncbi:hypothetical protein Tco_0093685 [Tanacetum coccineum]